MEIHQHIETRSGNIWIANALENIIEKSDEESRQEYEARFLQDFIGTILGDVELDHEPNGAPIFKNRPELHVSISHSENWFALYVSSKQPVGIDIEINSNKLEKAKKHFLTDQEIKHLQPTTQQLQICWGIKESVYKLLRGNLKSIYQEIEILSIDKNEVKAKFQDRIIELKHWQTDVLALVYTN
ncbi:MAG: 4'-phosphopantetheinyl transferase superfamily protein [Crocinitomicaceae bacterium]|nr:4'-phosphopantetheinyl transferase superfamily protein [Crocinitomicaceae bacterium]